MSEKYEPVIGLEVHIQLLTKSKIFCNCSAAFGADQNSQVCPVCLGLPGVLPVLNEKVVEFATRLALATNSRINKRSIFARKNYFYPDLPKGYQISQFEEPFCEHGFVKINVGDETRKIGLTRIHLEEDAGKSMHSESYVAKNETLVDINRCGVPLLEIVSEPEIKTPAEAYAYLNSLRQIVRYLGICDGNMEEGSLRCDANISVRPVGATTLGTKTELKNMNSFSAVEKALEYEINRQTQIVENGGKILQETLLWDADNNVAESMRSKEFSHDYRYFPDPDLVPVVIKQEYIENIQAQMPELPAAKKQRYVEEMNIPDYDAGVLTDDPELAQYFENVAQHVDDKKSASNWVMGEVLRTLKEEQCTISEMKVTPEYLAEILTSVDEGVITRKMGQKVFNLVQETGKTPKVIIKEQGLEQISDTSEIESIIENILNQNVKDVQAYQAGNNKVFGFFMGQVMRATGGKANPKTITEILKKKLESK